MIRLVPVAIACLLACLPALAAPPTEAELDAGDAKIEQALAALQRKDMASGARLLGEAARLQQDGKQAYQVAAFYTNFPEIADDAQALAWTRYAAELHHPAAMAAMGQRYLDGDGVPVDVAKGLEWLEAASSAGHAPAFGAAKKYRAQQGVKADCLRSALQAQGFVEALSESRFFSIREGDGATAAGDTYAVTGFESSNYPQRAALHVDGFAGAEMINVGSRSMFQGSYTSRPASPEARTLAVALRTRCGVAD